MCILTLNPGRHVAAIVDSLTRQTVRPDRLLIIDSNSLDGSPGLFAAAGFEVQVICREEFSHGRTRQLAVDLLQETEFVVFLTQDVLLRQETALATLLAAFADPCVGSAYGRQLPHLFAGPIESHARLFNYPAESRVKSLTDAPELGIKTPYISNSFAAYRRTALESVGGFPSNVILSEDTYVSAKMLLAGWKVAYCAEAQVHHSHDYGYLEEFCRYFDTGVFHAREPWIRNSFGQAGGEGLRFVRSELKFLWPGHFYLIPSAIVRSFAKIIAFKLGGWERWLPLWLKASLSMNKNFWLSEPSRRLAASKDGPQGKRSC